MVLEERLFHGKDYEDNDLVICTRTGKPMIPRNLRKEFYNLTEKLGLPKIRFHYLRHTCNDVDTTKYQRQIDC